METRPKTLGLGAMARVAHIPPTWLRQQAESGEIPSLDAGGERLFHVQTVLKILAERAARQRKVVRLAR